MANVERLTKRVKKIEEWVAENEEMGGPRGYMDTMCSLYQNGTMLSQQLNGMQNQFNQLRAYSFEFIQEQGLQDEWNVFLEEKDAGQKQTTEKMDALPEAEDGEEVGKEDTKGKGTSKESKETKKSKKTK